MRLPDYLCFVAYAVNAVQYVQENFPDVERVDFVVSRNQGVSGRFTQFKDSLRDFFKQENPALAPLVGDLIPASMEDRVPLQAADLLCWHMQRMLSNTADAEDERNWKILGDSNGRILPFHADALDKFADAIIRKISPLFIR